MTWKLYNDPAGTQVFSGTLPFVTYSDNPGVPQDGVLYCLEKELDPIDNGAYRMVAADGGNLLLYPSDLNPGTGHEVTEIKLATSAAGLDTAIAGAPLSLGPQLYSGVSNAVAVHVRVTTSITTPGVSVELGFDKNETHILSA
jgi:hypothetical protein